MALRGHPRGSDSQSGPAPAPEGRRPPAAVGRGSRRRRELVRARQTAAAGRGGVRIARRDRRGDRSAPRRSRGNHEPAVEARERVGEAHGPRQQPTLRWMMLRAARYHSVEVSVGTARAASVRPQQQPCADEERTGSATLTAAVAAHTMLAAARTRGRALGGGHARSPADERVAGEQRHSSASLMASVPAA